MGIVTDQEIFDLIVYDKEDDAFAEMLIPSVEEGAAIHAQEVSGLLDRLTVIRVPDRRVRCLFM